jgi:hypothetical protein
MIINISATAVYVLKVVGRLGLKLRAVLAGQVQSQVGAE